MVITNENVARAYEELEKLDFGQLDRADLGAQLNFADAAIRLQPLWEEAQLVKAHYDALRIPQDVESRLAQALTRLKELAQRILAFDLSGEPIPRRQGLINEINGLENSFHQDVHPLKLETELRSMNLGDTKELQAKLVGEIEAARQAKQEAENARKEADKIVQELRKLSVAGGSTTSSLTFLDESTNHEGLASKWLMATIVVGVIMVGLIFWLFYGKWPFNRFAIEKLANVATDKTGYYQIAHIIAFKLILISLGYLALYQCLKNYHIHRHLAVSNKHRHNTLNVYQTIGNAAEGETQQAILREAAKAIFEPVNSGYLDADGPAPVNLVEIANKMAAK